MDYSSSEDDELVKDFNEEDEILDIDHRNNIVSSSDSVEQQQVGDELLCPAGEASVQEPALGMEFHSEATARNFYNCYALRLGFGIRVARSRTERRKGVEVLVMKRFVCLKEGHHKKKVIADGVIKKKRKRLSIRDGCPAMMEVVRRGPDRWVVTKLVLEHSHIIVGPDKVREVQLGELSGKARERNNVLREMREKVFGECGAQGLLEYFKKMQAANSGFYYSMQVDSQNCMTNVFWASSRSRMAYNYFGDAVTFDTSYKKNELMMPFAAFTGVNQHGQTIVFGCVILIDKTESSFIWLFETWLAAMYGRHPLSLTTDQDKVMATAVAKVFPQTRHRFCRWRILSRIKKKLADSYSRYPTLYSELKFCINESETKHVFENCWRSILDRYGLRNNIWLHSLHDVRDMWIPAYLKDSFFAELSSTHRLETMNRFFRKHFNSRLSLQAFLTKFDQIIDGWYEREVQEDLETLHSQRILKTDSPLEKQAADTYTRLVFEQFQEELISALDHFAVEVPERGSIKYHIQRRGDTHSFHIVDFTASPKAHICTCGKFETSGILCRHVFAVLLGGRLSQVPHQYIVKRWTRKAKSGLVLEEEIRNYCQNSPILRYNDLFRDAVRCAEKGSALTETYRIAKDVLHKAFAEILQVASKQYCLDKT